MYGTSFYAMLSKLFIAAVLCKQDIKSYQEVDKRLTIKNYRLGVFLITIELLCIKIYNIECHKLYSNNAKYNHLMFLRHYSDGFCIKY